MARPIVDLPLPLSRPVRLPPRSRTSSETRSTATTSAGSVPVLAHEIGNLEHPVPPVAPLPARDGRCLRRQGRAQPPERTGPDALAGPARAPGAPRGSGPLVRAQRGAKPQWSTTTRPGGNPGIPARGGAPAGPTEARPGVPGCRGAVARAMMSASARSPPPRRRRRPPARRRWRPQERRSWLM